MADHMDSVSELRDLGVALSNNNNNNNDFSSDNNSDSGQTAGMEDDGEESPEPGVCDPDHMEERFRVDRKKLEEMLQGNSCDFCGLGFSI